MRKRTRKRLFSLMLSACLLMGLSKPLPVSAAIARCEYDGTNVESQNYDRWSDPMESFLYACPDGKLMRVQGVTDADGIAVEYYDSDFNLVSSRIIAPELPIFGGFYASDDYGYFIVTGQENTEESDSVEVFRITHYDSDWNRIGSDGLFGANTTVPFDAGSLRMTEYGKHLYIRTAHEMYTHTDGYNHQANVTIQMDMSTTEITDSLTKVSNNTQGYVSHSFNQFIKVENGRIIAVDHGDAIPRSLVLIKYALDSSNGRFSFPSSICQVKNIITFPGTKGENTTGATVGGFEISDSSYLIAGNSVVQDSSNLTRKTRNVFVAAEDKSTGEVTINWITNYAEGEASTTTPQLVQTSAGRYFVLWSRNNTVYYTEINGATGAQVGEIYSIKGNLSDCEPIEYDGNIVWYTWNNSTINFYTISLDDIENSQVTAIQSAHDFTQTSLTNGVATLVCSNCNIEKEVTLITSITPYWDKENDGSYITMSASQTVNVGDVLYSWVRFNPSNSNDMVQIKIDNTDVIAYTPTSDDMGTFTMLKTGRATVTISSKYNPSISKTFNFKVNGDLDIDSFTAEKQDNPAGGSDVVVNVSAVGGSWSYTYSYTFYDNAGNVVKTTDLLSDSTYTYHDADDIVESVHVNVLDSEGTGLGKVLEYHETTQDGVSHFGSLSYTDNENGTHTWSCDGCGLEKTTSHVFEHEDAECVCGSYYSVSDITDGANDQMYVQYRVEDDGEYTLRFIYGVGESVIDKYVAVGVTYSELDDNLLGNTIFSSVKAGNEVVQAADGTCFVVVQFTNVTNEDSFTLQPVAQAKHENGSYSMIHIGSKFTFDASTLQ